MQGVDHWCLDQWVTMQALEELAPGHCYELRFGIVLEAPGDLARRITPVGMGTPFLDSIVVQLALDRIQLLPESLQCLELVELAEESLILWRQLPGFISPWLLVVELLLEKLLQLGKPDGVVVRLESD